MESPLIPIQRIKAFAPEEGELILSPIYPWTSILEQGSPYWNEPMTRPSQIDHAKSVIIADFGLDSDTCVILDYRTEPPTVLRLCFSDIQPFDPRNNSWVSVADTFEDFARMLGFPEYDELGIESSSKT